MILPCVGGSNQCWVVFKCSLGSQPGSKFDSCNDNRLAPLHVRIGVRIDFQFSHE